MYTVTINKEDLSYIIAAIGQRAEMLQNSLLMQTEERQALLQEEERRAALPDPFAEEFEIKGTEIIIASDEIKPEKPAVSRKQKRAALMRILKSKGSADLSTAEIARRAGVSYVTAHKARAAFAPKKGRK